MKHRLLLSMIVLLVVAADGAKENDTKKDQSRLQGTWAFVMVEENGVKKTQRQLSGKEDELNWTFTGNVLVRNLGMELTKGAFRIDATKEPKEIDFADYSGKGRTVRGIYTFEGDHLKICVGSLNGSDRPKTFASKARSGHTNFLMKRHVVVNKD